MELVGPGDFGRHLRQLREGASLSQEELAERANLTAKAIGALERGERRRPYPNTVRALCSALGLDDETARTLAESVRKQSGEVTPVQSPRTGLPSPPAPMLGRATEVVHVLELLELPTTRLVTLTGPGGVGKTRLALEVAQQLQSGGKEVVLVELASISRIDLVMPSIARALGLQAGADDVIGSVAGLIVGRAPILFLDNFEHLLGSANDVAELIGRCPSIVVLATSRSPLRIRPELQVPIGPLPVPTPAADVAAIVAAPAVQVFADRARSVIPDFNVDPSNAVAVATISRRLDGLPLALELAAAHIRYLTPAQLLERLEHAVGSARLRDLPERQQTMTATLNWSHDLLTSDEQQVLRSLSVFAGGFDVAAAEEVARAPGRDVLSALDGLVEQSLVVGPGVIDVGTLPRLRLLEPVRLYAAASISAEEAAALADCHAAYYSGLARDARVGLRSTELPAWLDRLDTEHANLCAALTTQLDRLDFRAASELGGDTWLYWALRGHAGEGLIWWRRVLDEGHTGGLDEGGRAACHLVLAGLGLATGDLGAARIHGRSAADAAKAAGDDIVLAESLVIASTVAAFAGELSAATQHLRELSELGVDQHREWVRAHVLIVRAQLSLLEGDLDGCDADLVAAEELARVSAGQFTLGTVLNMRTTRALLLDDDDSALRSAAEAAHLAAGVGTSWTLVYTLSALATLAVRRGRPDLGAELFAASDATAETSLVAVAFRPDLEAAERHLRAVRRQLGADEFERCWARGRSLDVHEVLDLIPEISARRGPP